MKWNNCSAKMTARIFNEGLQALNLCNKVVTSMGGAGDSLQVLMDLFHNAEYIHSDVVTFNASPYAGITRGAVKKKTLVESNVYPQRGIASQLRWYGRGGFNTWGRGYDGVDTSDVVTGDLGFTRAENFYFAGVDRDYYVSDFYAGYDWPTSPSHAESLYIYGAGAPPWWPFSAHPKDVLDGGGGLIAGFYRNSPGDPAGPAWGTGQAEGWGRFWQYPLGQFTEFDLNGDTHVGAFGLPDPFQANVWWSRCNISLVPMGWPWLLRTLGTPGTTILQAKLRVKCTGLSKHDVSWSNVIVDGELENDTYSDVVTNTGITWVLFGRKLTPNFKEIIWEPLGISTGVTLAGDVFNIVDITAGLQAYVDNIAHGSVYDSFAWAPAPYADLVGLTDGRAFMASLLPNITRAYYSDPAWNGGPHGLQGGGDIDYEATGTAKWLTFSAVETPEIFVEWKLPDGEIKRAITPFNPPPMSDL